MKPSNWTIFTPLAIEARALGELSGDVKTVGIRAKRLPGMPKIEGGAILLAGLAGGLNPALRVGDVILDAGGNAQWDDLPGRRGKILTADHLVHSPDEKLRLFAATGCDAVDMEGDAVRKFADLAGIPLLHMRAISDGAEDSLPPRMTSWIDDVGRPKPGRLTVDLALHPGQIPAMIRLGRNSRLALRNLATAIGKIIRGESEN